MKAKCISSEYKTVTVNKCYEVIFYRVDGDHISVVNDNGNKVCYPSDCFMIIEPLKNEDGSVRRVECVDEHLMSIKKGKIYEIIKEDQSCLWVISNDGLQVGYPKSYFKEVDPQSTPTIKDSGQRCEFSTGAVRDIQDGKGRMDLLPVRALIRLAKHFEAGCKKYGENNWTKGIPCNRYVDSGMRHLLKWMKGDRDEDHLAAACWNLMCLMDTDERISEGVLPEELKFK